ncbi:uncharacterized protein LOC129797729 [Lutzomyia longipalpis]|nr:uncharacterized protein LOC129797729 [Lutzomyia longipalpis]
MLRNLLKVKDFSRINSYGTSSLVANFSQLSLRNVSVPLQTSATTLEVPRIAAFVENSNRIDVLSIGGSLTNQPHIINRYPLKEIRDVPRNPINIIEPPCQRILSEINSIIRQEKEIKLPEAGTIVEKHAVRLIVIRRKKMKKHKLRKLRKKMKYEWAKVRQRREMRKEKAFRAEIFAQIKEAETFSAEKYVEEKIRKATEVPIPRFWKNRRLPQFIIKEKLGIK